MATVVQFLSYYVIIIAIFYYFYFNRKGPLSKTELEVFCEWFEQQNHNPDGSIHFQPCKAFGASPDDGNEFYMLNLIKRPTSADLKIAQSLDIDVECKKSIDSLETCYGKRIMPLIFKRFSFPIFIVKPSWNDPMGISKSLIGKGITENFDFDMIAIVRYRSKRDFLEMTTEIINNGEIIKYKDLSVNKTAVYVLETFMPISTWIAFTAGLVIIGIFYSMLFWVIAGAVF